MRRVWLLPLFLLSLSSEAQTLRAGVATGFPPYQYLQDGRPAGLDVELAEAVAQEAGVKLLWKQDRWDELTSTLRLTEELDLLTGMEGTGDRGKVFLLGRPLYVRRNLLFVLASDRAIYSVDDLDGRPVARDRDAFSDELLTVKGIKSGVRLVKTDSKEEAFAALVTGKVVAAFMPEAVGKTLARAQRIAVRTIDLGDPGSPVSLAFRRDQGALARRMDEAAARLESRGVLKRILDRY